MRTVRTIFVATTVLIMLLFILSCNKDNEENNIDLSKLSDYERINKFIIDGIRTYYFKADETNWKQYDHREILSIDHEKLFNQLIHKDDKWSFITDDVEGEKDDSFFGVANTFGYTLSFYHNPFVYDEVIAVVLYTMQFFPASEAGLKRGDIIIELNGEKITSNNYKELYYASNISVRCGRLDIETESFTPLTEVKHLTSLRTFEREEQIYTLKIIEKEGHKIGYLLYNHFHIHNVDDLIRTLEILKNEGVNDVVLDLRFNRGGHFRIAQILSSILAPEDVMKNKSVYLDHYYNNLYTSFLKNNDYSLSEYFIDLLPVNMNLKRLYVLTGKRTASASEATIAGLEPYMQIIQIGDTTSGMFCNGMIISPEDIYGKSNADYYKNFSNFGICIMNYRFDNIKGQNSFNGGLAPNVLATENDFDLIQLGDEDEPLLSIALAHIMGEPYSNATSVNPFPVIALPDIKKPVEGMFMTPQPLIQE